GQQQFIVFNFIQFKYDDLFVSDSREIRIAFIRIKKTVDTSVFKLGHDKEKFFDMKKLRLYLQVIQQCILILPYSPNKLQKALFSTLLVIRFNDLPQSGLFIFAGLTVSFVMGKYKFR